MKKVTIYTSVKSNDKIVHFEGFIKEVNGICKLTNVYNNIYHTMNSSQLGIFASILEIHLDSSISELRFIANYINNREIEYLNIKVNIVEWMI